MTLVMGLLVAHAHAHAHAHAYAYAYAYAYAVFVAVVVGVDAVRSSSETLIYEYGFLSFHISSLMYQFNVIILLVLLFSLVHRAPSMRAASAGWSREPPSVTPRPSSSGSSRSCSTWALSLSTTAPWITRISSRLCSLSSSEHSVSDRC